MPGFYHFIRHGTCVIAHCGVRSRTFPPVVSEMHARHPILRCLLPDIPGACLPKLRHQLNPSDEISPKSLWISIKHPSNKAHSAASLPVSDTSAAADPTADLHRHVPRVLRRRRAYLFPAVSVGAGKLPERMVQKYRAKSGFAGGSVSSLKQSLRRAGADLAEYLFEGEPVTPRTGRNRQPICCGGAGLCI